MLYKGNAAKESSTGGQYEPGAYKFKVVSAKMNDWGGLNFELKTWNEEGGDGPKILDSLRFSSESEAMKAEVDRRLTVLLGKPEIEKESDIVGKTGYVVLRKGQKYLEVSPFGGFYDKDKKGPTGNDESILNAIKQAVEYDWTKDSYAVSKAGGSTASASAATTPENEDNMPF